MRLSIVAVAGFLLLGMQTFESLASGHTEGGDAAKGEELAREACTGCHNVDAGGVFKQDPPSFAAIAVYRSKEQIFGRILYAPLHTGMSNLGYRLTPDNVRHLIAYIVSLEKH